MLAELVPEIYITQNSLIYMILRDLCPGKIFEPIDFLSRLEARILTPWKNTHPIP